MSISFEGQVAIVTGAGAGIGRSHALELARRGAKVVVNDLGKCVDGVWSVSAAATAVVDEIVAAGGEAIANGGSVAERSGAQSMVDDAMNAWGRVDILINNAGIVRDKSFAKMTLDEFDLIVAVHLTGAGNCAHAVWPIMQRQKYGRIVMTSSPAALAGNFGQANYSAAKLGQVGLMQTLTLEGKRDNIRVNTIVPWAVTAMSKDIIPEAVHNKFKSEQVSAGALFLASSEAPSGVMLDAKGGKYSTYMIMQNEGYNLGADATVEDVAAAFDKISDASITKPLALSFDI